MFVIKYNIKHKKKILLLFLIFNFPVYIDLSKETPYTFSINYYIQKYTLLISDLCLSFYYVF